MDINDISPELQEKARACETVEELHELLKEEGMEIPDSLKVQLGALLASNMELSVAWARFNSDAAMLNSEELIQFFQMERLNEIALNAKIPLVFYFLTLVLLLSTFFFMFRSKQ